MNYSNSQRAGVILYLTALLFGGYDYYAPVKFGEYQSCFDSTTTCHVGFYVDWDEKKDFRKDLGYWIKMIDAEVVGNIHDKPEQQKDQRSTIIYKDFMKKGRE